MLEENFIKYFLTFQHTEVSSPGNLPERLEFLGSNLLFVFLESALDETDKRLWIISILFIEQDVYLFFSSVKILYCNSRENKY